MLDICNKEIVTLDLRFNVSKSVVMRVGSRWDKPCVGFDLGSSTSIFTDSIKYLGMYLKSSSKFVCS